MQTSRPSQRKAVKFLDAKIFIAAMSVAVTAGLWNLFSVNAVQADQAIMDTDSGPPPEPPLIESQDLHALPTLVPLVKVEIPQPGSLTAAPRSPASNSSLRSVTAPTPVVVQKFKPMIDQPQPVVVDNGRSGKSTKSVTRTRTSR